MKLLALVIALLSLRAPAAARCPATVALGGADGFQFVFSHGFLGEPNPALFKFAVFDDLRYIPGVRRRSVEIHPDSRLGLDDNAERFAASLGDLIAARGGRRPIVIGAFSYSAAIWFRALTRHPELLPFVRAVYTVSGAFGGSHIADCINDPACSRGDGQLPWLERTLFRFLIPIQRWGSGTWQRGLRDLGTGRMQEQMRETVALARTTTFEGGNVADALDRRFRYVLAYEEARHNRWFRRPEHTFLERNYGLSDGTIRLDHQFPSVQFAEPTATPMVASPVRDPSALPAPVLGRVLLIVDGITHAELTEADRLPPPARVSARVRRGILARILADLSD